MARGLHTEAGRTALAGAVALVVLVAAVVALPGGRDQTSGVTSGGVASDPGSAMLGRHARPSSGLRAAGVAADGPVSRDGSLRPVASAPAPGSRFVPAKAPGVTRGNVYIGVAYFSEQHAAVQALGASGAQATYDSRDVWNSVIDYANRHGGFAGRRMKAIYFDYKLLTADGSNQDQTACAFYTQDHKVFAFGGGSDVLNSCAERAGAVPVSAGAAATRDYAKYPHLIDPLGIAFDRLSRVTANGLYRAGYFTGKLGVVTWDDPRFHYALDQGYRPLLAKYGVRIVATQYIKPPDTFGEIGSATASINGAVTKFKSLGIDHVIVQDGPASVLGSPLLTLEWMNAAKSQRYYPRYGQNFWNAPGWSGFPSDEMDHALALNDSDFDRRYDEGWRVNTARERCFEIEARAGYSVNRTNVNDEIIAVQACDIVFWMQRILNGLRFVTADAFVAATLHLGTTLETGLIYGTKLSPGRRDGSDMVRLEEYLDSCKCLKFLGPPRRDE